jgi:hypothetical protein
VSLLDELAERFSKSLPADTDVSTLGSLAQHYALLTGRAVTAEPDLAVVDLGDADVGRQLSKLLERDQDFIRLADHDDRAIRRDRLDALLADFCSRYFPVAAPWESQGDTAGRITAC